MITTSKSCRRAAVIVRSRERHAAREARNATRGADAQARHRSLGGRKGVECQQAHAAQAPQRAERRSEQAHEPVREGDDALAVLVTPAGIGAQRGLIADVGPAGCQRVRNHFREARCVAQPQIETLSRDGMQRLCGIADDGEPRRHVPLRARQRERIGIPGADAQQPAEAVAEGGLQVGEEFLVGQREESRSFLWTPHPHDAAPTVCERQDGDRPIRSETLVGHVVVETLRRERGDDRSLAVLPVLGRHARLLADDGTRTVRGHDQPGLDIESLAAALDAERAPFVRQPGAGDSRRCERLDTGHAAQPLPESRADHAVGQHVAERVQPLLGCVDACDAEAALLGNVDAADRGRLALHVAPDVEAAEYPYGAVGQCGRALVETRVLHGAGRHRLNERDPEPERGECQRERGADQAAPGNGDVELPRFQGLGHESARCDLTNTSRARSRRACAAARR